MMRRFIKCWLIVAVVAYLVGTGQAKESVSIDREEVGTPYGVFVLHDAHAEKTAGKLVVWGEITNTTDRAWTYAVFRVQFFDSSGTGLIHRLGYDPQDVIVTLTNVQKGQTESVHVEVGGNLTGKLAQFHFIWDKNESAYASHYVFALLKPKANNTLYYEDESLSFAFSLSSSQITVSVLNKTDAPAVISWDEVSYIDPTSTSHRVIHGNTRLIERDKPQVPQVIPPTAKITEALYPADYVLYSSVINEWTIQPLFDSGKGDDPMRHRGAGVGLYIPVEVRGSKKPYFFRFGIDVELD